MSRKVQPKGTEAPLTTVPSEVEVTDDDADRAVALWNRDMDTEHEGLLEATPI